MRWKEEKVKKFEYRKKKNWRNICYENTKNVCKFYNDDCIKTNKKIKHNEIAFIYIQIRIEELKFIKEKQKCETKIWQQIKYCKLLGFSDFVPRES